MSKHTPGPWKVSGGGNAPVIQAQDDTWICTSCAPTKEEARNNARIIAAAPDLLEAANSALKLLRGSGFTESTGAVIQLKAAIAKAEGNL
jgi:hypothetical protein